MSSDHSWFDPNVYSDPFEIKMLPGRVHVRDRPGIYIGDCGKKGLHHLVLEPVHNSIDEWREGRCKRVVVELLADGGCCISDDGPGISVDFTEPLGQRFVEAVLTHVGPVRYRKRNNISVSAGLRGVGLVTVNSLSARFHIRISRDGNLWSLTYERGIASGPLTSTPGSDESGTCVTFWPDPQIFQETCEFDYALLDERLRELAFLNAGIEIALIDRRHFGGISDVFLFPQGVADFLSQLNREEDAVHSIIRLRFEAADAKGRRCEFDLALQWTESDEERIGTYANSAHTQNGGTHLAGFRQGIALAIRRYLGASYKMDDIVVGLKAIIAVHLPEPRFAGSTKATLANPEVEWLIQSRVSELMMKYLEEHTNDARAILERIQGNEQSHDASQSRA